MTIMKYFRKRVWCIPASLLVFFPSVVARADALDDYIQQEMHHRRIPGLAVALVHRNGEVDTRAYGQANIESGSPVTSSSVFEIGSLTKQFTAAAVLMLVEEGRLSLEDKTSAHLTGIPAGWQAVTIRQLLNHTSGIKDFLDQPGFNAMRRSDHTPNDLLALVTGEPLDFPPGAKFEYSNSNYLLLGMLIEHLSGQPYGQFLHDRIFAPLGMHHTRTNKSAEIIVGRVRGYTRVPGQTQNAVFFSPTNAFGAGNLISNITDLARWDAALYEGKLLTPESYRELWTPSSASQADGDPYGFGWDIKTENEHRLFAHAGNITGFSSAILHYPDDHFTLIVLTNLGFFNAERLALSIAREVEPTLVHPLPVAVEDPDPKTTARLRHLFLGMMSGEMRSADFSDKLDRELGPQIRQGQAESRLQAAENGRLESFELLEREESEQGLSLVYRAAFEYRTRVKVFISLDHSGRITKWGVRFSE